MHNLTRRVYKCKTEMKVGGTPRFGRRADGSFDGEWFVCMDGGALYRPGCAVYSFGVGGDWSFEEGISNATSCSVHAFDPTETSPPLHNPGNVAFAPIALGPRDATVPEPLEFGLSWRMGRKQTITGDIRPSDQRTWQQRTLGSLMDAGKKRILELVKMDVEYSEWEALLAASANGTLRHVEQLVIEMHISRRILEQNYVQRAFDALHRNGFRLFHSVPNTHAQTPRVILPEDYVATSSGVRNISCCWELSFWRTHHASAFEPARGVAYTRRPAAARASRAGSLAALNAFKTRGTHARTGRLKSHALSEHAQAAAHGRGLSAFHPGWSPHASASKASSKASSKALSKAAAKSAAKLSRATMASAERVGTSTLLRADASTRLGARTAFRRASPRSIALSAPAARAATSCLRGKRLMMQGFCELREMTGWLHAAANCEGAPPSKDDVCHRRLTDKNNPFANHRNLSYCMEDLYSRQPYRATCASANMSLAFEWKSFMLSSRDEVFRQRVLAAAADGTPVTVVMNAGTHHFAKFHDHAVSSYFDAPDDFAWPQAWIDDFVLSTRRLLAAFAPATLPKNVCVLWKTMNIGPRQPVVAMQSAPPLSQVSQHGTDGSAAAASTAASAAQVHHPSARNGLHDWLNRISIALATEVGVGVVDLSDLTLSHPPTPRLPQPRPGMASPEGDIYHGYSAATLLPGFTKRVCEACAYAKTRAAGRSARSSAAAFNN